MKRWQTEQSDEASRKALQAAWRRYDRTGKQRVKKTAEKIFRKMSRMVQIPTLVK